MQVTKGLEASEGYLAASPEVVAQVTNGCGPGGWKFDIIPDHIWGLSIKEPCNVHDWDYTVGKSDKDKMEADARFKRNCLYLVDNAKGFWATLLRAPRRVRVQTYYEAVHLAGGPAFWANKQGGKAA